VGAGVLALDHRHVVVVDAEHVDGDLGHGRLGARPGTRCPDVDRHLAIVMEADATALPEAGLDGRLLLRHPEPFAVEGRREPARLDERRDADAEVPALLPEPFLLLAELLVVDHLHRFV
jgi:hypothetical protein